MAIDTPGTTSTDLLDVAEPPPHPPAAADEVPDLLDRAVGDRPGDTAPGGRRKWAMLPRSPTASSRTSDPSGAIASGSGRGCG